MNRLMGFLSQLSSGALMLDVIQLAIFAAFILGMIFLPSGVWRIGRLRTKNQLEATLDDIMSKQKSHEISKLTPALQDLYNDAGSKESYLTKKIFAAIDYAGKRHDWYEDQRSRVFQVAMALFSAVLAFLAIVSRSSLPADPRIKTVVISLGLIALLSLLRMVFLYNHDLDADRPYRLVSDVRFWYFRYNLPGKSQGSVSKKNASGMASEVAQERARFTDRILKNVNVKESIREDLEQIFILQVLQRYKSESLVRMRWVLSYFLIFGSLQALIFSIVSIFK